jgi:hypothetical protein
MGRPRGGLSASGFSSLAAWPARLASMTHLSANLKGASCAILVRLSSAVFSSGYKKNKEGDRERSLLCDYLTM